MHAAGNDEGYYNSQCSVDDSTLLHLELADRASLKPITNYIARKLTARSMRFRVIIFHAFL